MRAISVALVLADHLSLSSALPFTQRLVDLGNLGVRVFFLISGFIVTKLLLDEREKTGRISLRAFYIRRVFRIIPIWACFLVATAGMLTVAHRAPQMRDWLSVLTFNADLLRPWTVDFQHLWSLSVEEKFYLLWPLVLVFSKPKIAGWVPVLVLVIIPVIRLFVCLHGAGYDARLEPFYVSMDAIATGCCLALARERLHASRAWMSLIQSRWAWLLPVVIVGIAASHRTGLLYWTLGITALNVAIALWLEVVMMRPHSSVGTILNSRPLVALGAWSYGLYLWQQPLSLHRKGGILWTFPLDAFAVVLIAVAGYYAIEKPAQEYGRRLSKNIIAASAKLGIQPR
jgi:peptidoglycan/LPS O-acetylase OafA/YrhL